MRPHGDKTKRNSHRQQNRMWNGMMEVQ